MDKVIVQRYWGARGEHEASFAFFNGYLAEPRTEGVWRVNENLAKFSDLEQFACLVLLGEPGSGKSTAMEGAKRDAIRRAASSGDLVLWRDLAEFSTRQDILTGVFSGQVWEDWRGDSKRRLNLYLDSLDKCHVDLPNVVQVLLSALGELPDRSRLRLRVACRTGVWPASLEIRLASLFSEPAVRVYQLAPLTATDVRKIAGQVITNVEDFMEEVARRSAQPFAIKPVTLELLVNLYRSESHLPKTLFELYRQGCRSLCQEVNPSRLAARKIGRLNADQRFAIASNRRAHAAYRQEPNFEPTRTRRPSRRCAFPRPTGWWCRANFERGS
jgi:hypothetical protein